MTGAAADNDILFKGAWYGLLREIVSVIPSSPSDTFVLGHAKFVVGKRLQKLVNKNVPGASRALDSLTEFLAEVVQAEPTSEEQLFAATIENAAQVAGLALDSGESLLCAMMVRRGLQWLATGDKRAIHALEMLFQSNVEVRPIAGRVVCLEQLFVRLLEEGTPSRIRAAVCREAHVDKALTACFACSSASLSPDDWCTGLRSYINALRVQAPTFLAP
jgi:hypothetical protein